VLVWLTIFRIMRAERPVIVHTHTAKAGAIGRTSAVVHNLLTRIEGSDAGPRCRLVHTFHGHVLQGYFGGWRTRLYRLIEQLLARVTDRIIVVSEAVGDDLLRLGVGTFDSIRVIKLGIPLDDLLRLPPPPAEPVTFIGSVGRLVPIKNHQMLLAAARGCMDDPVLRNLRFRIVGDGELRPTLERRVTEEGLDHSVRFDGWCHDVTSIYAHIDAVCLTSRAEGTPVSVIEALASARPAIVTDVGGVRDLMGPIRGRVGPVEIAAHGLIVQPNDVEGLVLALRFLVQHPETALDMGLAGRHAVEREYTVERLIRNTRSCYEELLPELATTNVAGPKLVPFGVTGTGARDRVP
jgi:glycosyltransferase involved in cell wall biosynthesis